LTLTGRVSRTYFGQQSIIDEVVAETVDNSDSNTLLALVAVTKALGQAAQQRLDEAEREAVQQSSKVSRISRIARMAFCFHPYVQSQAILDSCAAGNYHDVWLDGEHENDFAEGDEDEDV
jgi:hypothetical protein